MPRIGRSGGAGAARADARAWAPRGYFNRTRRNGYLDERLVAEYSFKRTGAGLDLGYNSGRRAEVRLGFDSADVRGRLRVGNPLLPEVEGAEQVARLQFTYDDQTSPMVPTRGLHLRSRLRYFAATPQVTEALDPRQVESIEQFWQGEVVASRFWRARGEDRVFVLFGIGSSFGDDPLVNDFSLGGPLRLGAYNSDELRGPNYVLGTAGYMKRVGRLADVIGGNIFLGAWLENGDTFARWGDASWRTNLSGGLIMETLLGPIFLGASTGFDGRGRVYVSVGPLVR
jgi:NTE family protein